MPKQGRYSEELGTPLILVRASFGVLIALWGKDMTNGKTEEAFS